MTVQQAAATWEYQNRMNEKFVPEAVLVAREYKALMESQPAAQAGIAATGFRFSEMIERGFRFNGKTGLWEQIPLAANATDEQKVEHLEELPHRSRLARHGHGGIARHVPERPDRREHL